MKTTNPSNPVQADREKPGNQGGKPGQGGQGGRQGNPFPPRRDHEQDFGKGEPDGGEEDR